MNKAPMRPDYNPYLNVGDVFAVVKKPFPYRELQTTYWKVTEIKSRSHDQGDYAYSVIKCNKNGKEFKDTNGFSTHIDSYLRKLYEEPATRWDVGYLLVKRNVPVGVKANIDKGLVVGKLKRRFDYLKARREADKDEMNIIVDRLTELEK